MNENFFYKGSATNGIGGTEREDFPLISINFILQSLFQIQVLKKWWFYKSQNLSLISHIRCFYFSPLYFNPDSLMNKVNNGCINVAHNRI